MEKATAPSAAPQPKPSLGKTLNIVLSVLGAFLLFLFALDLMISSFQEVSSTVIDTIIQATVNPFTGLFIGLLITAMVQSSSTTTALVVAMVASGSLTLQTGIPIIMGANVGTTITALIVSLGFFNKPKEFRRATSAGTYHCFFNLLTVLILFPLEYHYSFLSSSSAALADYFYTIPESTSTPSSEITGQGSNPLTRFFLRHISSRFILIILSFFLLFGSIILFRRIISNLLINRSSAAFNRFFFAGGVKSFSWGLLTTAAIRSSTITTSLVVPIVAKKIATLRQVAPFIMGANVGTTVTAFIAATLNPHAISALSIAIAHFLFNVIGVIVFFPIPALRKIPVSLSDGLGRITLKYRLAGFVFLLMVFFFIPFVLIYFNRDTVKTVEVIYEQQLPGTTNQYRMISRMNRRTNAGEWTLYNSRNPDDNPAYIYPVSVKNRTLFVGDELYLLNKPGFCWDSEDAKGKYKACVEAVMPDLTVAGVTFDSVYVFSMRYTHNPMATRRVYLSARYFMILMRHELRGDSVLREEKIITFEEK